MHVFSEYLYESGISFQNIQIPKRFLLAFELCHNLSYPEFFEFSRFC